MQVGQAQVVRANWFDRTPLPIMENYTGAVAGHGLTVRASYTAPVNRVLKISLINLGLYRITAGIGGSVIQFRVVIKDELGVTIGTHTYNYIADVLYESKGVTQTLDMLIPAEHKLEIWTYDSDPGGLIQYSINMLGIEYDA